jgi:N-methylhydantoinase A/oxoprolinase/acetone carboxylase beta subunit
VSCSHEIAPRIGEYYRIAATVMNSYVGPLMTQYVGDSAAGAGRQGYGKREGTNTNKDEMYLPMLDAESIGAGGGSIADCRASLFGCSATAE